MPPQVRRTHWRCLARANNRAAQLEVKLKAPNGVNFTAKGTSAHDGPVSSSVCLNRLIHRRRYR